MHERRVILCWCGRKNRHRVKRSGYQEKEFTWDTHRASQWQVKVVELIWAYCVDVCYGVTRFDEGTLVFSRLQKERQLDEAALSFSDWKRMRRRHFGNICETFLSETDMKGRMYISCLCIKYSEGEPWLSSKAGSRGKHEAWLCSEIKKKVHQPKSLKLTK